MPEQLALVIPVFGQRDSARSPLAGIHAASGSQNVLKMEFGALQIPAFLLAWALFFHQPQMKQRLLHEILTQVGVRSQLMYHPCQKVLSRTLLDQHSE